MPGMGKLGGAGLAAVMKKKAPAAPKVGGGLTTGGGGGVGMPKPLPSPASPRARVGGMGRRKGGALSPTKRML